NYRSSLRGTRRRVLCSAPRDVRHCSVGHSPQTPCAGARSNRQEAPVLFLGWQEAGIWFGNQGPLGCRRNLERAGLGSSFGLFLVSIHTRTEDHLSERPKTAPRSLLGHRGLESS